MSRVLQVVQAIKGINQTLVFEIPHEQPKLDHFSWTSWPVIDCYKTVNRIHTGSLAN